MSWHPTREDCFVLNVDGSCLCDGRAGAGGLIRIGDGNWVTGFSGFMGIANNTYAELMTLFFGVKLANNMGCNQVCCYSDSKTIIDIVTKRLTSTIAMLLSLLVFRIY